MGWRIDWIASSGFALLAMTDGVLGNDGVVML